MSELSEGKHQFKNTDENFEKLCAIIYTCKNAGKCWLERRPMGRLRVWIDKKGRYQVAYNPNGELLLHSCHRNDMKCVEFWDCKVCHYNEKGIKITDLRYKHLEKRLESIIKGG